MCHRSIRYYFSVTTLVRSDTPEDRDPERLSARATKLQTKLDEHGAEAAQLKMDLEVFGIHYRQQVGTLHEQLDTLELAIAEAELGELSKRVTTDASDPKESRAGARTEPLPRYTSDEVRRLFRDVAKAIHPDLAGDEAARDRRHTLMIEANRAYASGDEEQLRWILQARERSPEAVQGSDPEAMRVRLVRRIAELEEQLAMLATDRAALKASPLWKLKAMVDEGTAKGKDLVRDMVARLNRDILVARNRLDALRPPT